MDSCLQYNVNMKYKSNKNVLYSCKYHVVWCPKYRRSVLVEGIDERLKELIQEICDEINVEIFEMEVMPDHVDLLIENQPAHSRDFSRELAGQIFLQKSAEMLIFLAFFVARMV